MGESFLFSHFDLGLEYFPPSFFWGLWKARNDGIFRDQKSLLLKVRRIFLNAIKENIKLFKGKVKKPYPKSEQTVLDKFTLGPVELHIPKKNSSWIRPGENVVKLNFDGASKGNLGPAGGGGILRNSEGDWLFAYAGPLGRQTNNMVEARALLWGVLLAKEKGFKDIQIE
ncbi:hypothetical protein KI387_041984, partial [Taxus chinensis]